MRFSCKIFLATDTITPSDYRRHLLSLIKEALKRSGSDGASFYERFYDNNTTKPFTFSAYFPLQHGKLNGDFFSFFFSTNDYEFLMRVYNGLIDIDKAGNFQLFNSQIKIKKIFLLPEKGFTKNVATFKTLSPFLVRSLEDGDKYLYLNGMPLQTRNSERTGDHWKYWQETDREVFINSLRSSIKTLLPDFNFLSSDNIDIEISSGMIVPILHGSGNSNHAFTITFPGIKGLITIKAEPEILKLLYDIGIGARRSEGFGMLEVVE